MDFNLLFTTGIQINANREKVWDSLTNPEKIKDYLFGTETITDWKVGSPIVFQGEYQGKHYKDEGKILTFKPNEILEYTYWSGFAGLPNIPENYSYLTFKLEGNNNHTKLLLTQKGFTNEEAMKHSLMNWNKVLEKIKESLE